MRQEAVLRKTPGASDALGLRVVQAWGFVMAKSREVAEMITSLEVEPQNTFAAVCPPHRALTARH
jgi:hypothetical protein